MRNDIWGTALSYPAIDPRTDLTGLYLFPSPERQRCTVVAVSLNPQAGTSWFRQDAVYEVLVTEGDARPRLALRFRFTACGTEGAEFRLTLARLTREITDGHIHEDLETVSLAEHAPVSVEDTPVVTETDSIRLFAGIRSNPLFLDGHAGVEGSHPSDPYRRANTLAIVADLPNELLGNTDSTGVWARALVPMVAQRDHYTQLDAEGLPLVAALLPDRRDRYALDRAMPWLQGTAVTSSGVSLARAFATRLAETGGYPTAEAETEALRLLPTVLVLDRPRPTGFPNGRLPQDDAADWVLRTLSGGRIRGRVSPHADYLDHFPYLGNPHVR